MPSTTWEWQHVAADATGLFQQVQLVTNELSQISSCLCTQPLHFVLHLLQRFGDIKTWQNLQTRIKPHETSQIRGDSMRFLTVCLWRRTRSRFDTFRVARGSVLLQIYHLSSTGTRILKHQLLASAARRNHAIICHQKLETLIL